MPDKENGELREEFELRGFVKLPKFFSEDEISELREEIIKASERLETVSTLNKDNMIFHSNLFAQSEYLQTFLSQEKIVRTLRSILGSDMWIRWDQCVAKAAGGAEFPWHQDNAYNKLKDAHLQFWIGITEMTTENGGLWLQPGSHRMGMLPHEMQGHHLACTKLPGEGEFIAADKGDVVLFSSFMLHRTKKNNSDSDRWAYVVEYMSTDHYDPLVDPPFFVVTEDGEPRPRFVDSYEGREKLANRLKYSGVILKTKSKRLVGRLKKSVLGGAN